MHKKIDNIFTNLEEDELGFLKGKPVEIIDKDRIPLGALIVDPVNTQNIEAYSMIKPNQKIRFEYQGHAVNGQIINIEEKSNEATGQLDKYVLVKTNMNCSWYKVDEHFRIIG
jgi:hypothetical protein